MPTREEKQKLIAMGSRIAREHGIDPSLLLALIEQESDWNPKAVSSTGAQGLGQLMPGTARGLKVSDPFDPEQNLRGAARYLRQQLQTFGGSEEKALAAYNAGPGAVKKYGGVPPFDETKAYVPSVQRRRAGYAGERWKPIAVPLTYEEEAAAIERRLAPKKARPVPPAEETLTYEEEAAAIERRLAPKKERPLYQKAAVTLGKPGDFFRASLATLAKSQGEKGIRYLDESMAEAFGAGWDAFLDRGKAYEPRLFREMFRLKPGTIASRAAGWADYAADLLWNPGDVLTGAAVGKGLRLASKGAARLPAVQRAGAAVSASGNRFLTETKMGQQAAQVAYKLGNVGPVARLQKAVVSPFLKEVDRKQVTLSNLNREITHFVEATAKAGKAPKAGAEAARGALLEYVNGRLAADAGQVSKSSVDRIAEASAFRVGADPAELKRLGDALYSRSDEVWKGLGYKATREETSRIGRLHAEAKAQHRATARVAGGQAYRKATQESEGEVARLKSRADAAISKLREGARSVRDKASAEARGEIGRLKESHGKREKALLDTARAAVKKATDSASQELSQLKLYQKTRASELLQAAKKAREKATRKALQKEGGPFPNASQKAAAKAVGEAAYSRAQEASRKELSQLQARLDTRADDLRKVTSRVREEAFGKATEEIAKASLKLEARSKELLGKARTEFGLSFEKSKQGIAKIRVHVDARTRALMEGATAAQNAAKEATLAKGMPTNREGLEAAARAADEPLQRVDFIRQFADRTARAKADEFTNAIRPVIAYSQRGKVSSALDEIVNKTTSGPGTVTITKELAEMMGVGRHLEGKAIPEPLVGLLESVEKGTRTFNPQAVLGSKKAKVQLGAWKKSVSLIKGGWVRNNPATTIFNGISNITVAEEAAKMHGALGGEVSYVLPRAMADWYELRKTGRAHPDILEARQLTESFSKTFAGDKVSWGGLIGKVPGMKALGALVDSPGQLFEINELGTKLALYRVLKKRLGPVQAAKVVEDVLFNYNDVAPWLKAMDVLGLWVFNTFTTRATALVLRTAATRPDVIAKYLRVQPARMEATPGSEERFADLPAYARTPFTIPVGEEFTTAFGKATPFGLPITAAETAVQSMSGAMSPMNALLSLVPTGEEALGAGIPGALIGPALNRNLLTGGEIAPPGTPPDVGLSLRLRAVAQGLLPSLTPGGGPIPQGRGFERISAAFGGAAPMEGRGSEPQEMDRAAVQALLGVPIITGETPEARQSRLLGEPRTQVAEARAIIHEALALADQGQNPYAGRFAQETSLLRLSQELRDTRSRLRTLVISVGRMTPDRANRIRAHTLYLRAIQDRGRELGGQ